MDRPFSASLIDEIDFYQLGGTFILIFSLVVNLHVCLVYKMCVFWVVFKGGPLLKNPVNALIVIDESFKMLVLFGESFLVYASLTGQTFRQMFGDWCRLEIL